MISPETGQNITDEEFKKFISVVNDIKWIIVFEILYYRGLRHRELRGLQCKDTNFDGRTLSISKQITDRCEFVKNFHFVALKNYFIILKSWQTLINIGTRKK